MLRSVGQINNGAEDDNADSGAETAESDCSKMSSSSSDVMCPPGRDPPLIAMHVLANPGDSLLFEHALDHLLGWLCPGLHFFHVSERACPLRSRTRSRPGYPSLAVTLFLHESRGQERILQVLDSLQRPPWSYHHTESGRAGGIHAADAGPRPYLLSSRDFYSLGPGMPVWAVRTVHCGSELLRVTLHCSHADFEDAVRLYETVLRRGAEQQKPGFCWFALRLRPGLHLQLALKQLAPAVRVEPCDSAVLQFQVEEIGQLVPLLPNPCTPISATRWQTEDLDGNKILFQVKGLLCHATSPISAFQLNGSISLCKPLQTQAGSPSSLELQQKDPGLSTTLGAQGLYRWPAGLAADSRCSTPAGSSCYSSQCSSPGALQGLLPEEGETDVDTGCAISPTRDGPAVLENFATELQASLPASKASTRPHCRPGGTIHSLGLSCPRRELPALLHPCNTQAGGCMPQEEEFFI